MDLESDEPTSVRDAGESEIGVSTARTCGTVGNYFHSARTNFLHRLVAVSCITDFSRVDGDAASGAPLKICFR